MDIYQNFGSDIVASQTGDLQTVNGTEKTNQRILRRLLTNPGDYIWHPTYGAGLPKYVGQPLSAPVYIQIKGLIQQQLRSEASVSQNPAPVVTLQPIDSGLTCQIEYTHLSTKTKQTLSFTVK